MLLGGQLLGVEQKAKPHAKVDFIQDEIVDLATLRAWLLDK
jgi:hypothetical protein